MGLEINYKPSQQDLLEEAVEKRQVGRVFVHTIGAAFEEAGEIGTPFKEVITGKATDDTIYGLSEGFCGTEGNVRAAVNFVRSGAGAVLRAAGGVIPEAPGNALIVSFVKVQEGFENLQERLQERRANRTPQK
jgi:hypothetical protein